MSNNKQTKDECFISRSKAFMIGFSIGGIVGILILDAVIKGIL